MYEGLYDHRIHPPEQSTAYVKAVAEGGHAHLFASDLPGVPGNDRDTFVIRRGMFERLVLRRELADDERVEPTCGEAACIRPEHMTVT